MSDEDKGYAKSGSFAGIEAEEQQRSQHFDRSLESELRSGVSTKLSDLFGGGGGGGGGGGAGGNAVTTDTPQVISAPKGFVDGADLFFYNGPAEEPGTVFAQLGTDEWRLEGTEATAEEPGTTPRLDIVGHYWDGAASQQVGAWMTLAPGEVPVLDFSGAELHEQGIRVAKLGAQQEFLAGQIFSGLVDGADTVEFRADGDTWPGLGFRHNAGEVDEAYTQISYDPDRGRLIVYGQLEGEVYDGEERVYSANNPPPAAGGGETVAVRANHGAQAFSGGWNVLTFSGEWFDTHGIHAAGTPTRFTVPEGQGGTYAISVSIRLNLGATAIEQASYIRTDGADQSSDVHSIIRSTVAAQTLAYTELLELAAGDYAEVMVLGGDGTANATVRMWKV